MKFVIHTVDGQVYDGEPSQNLGTAETVVLRPGWTIGGDTVPASQHHVLIPLQRIDVVYLVGVGSDS